MTSATDPILLNLINQEEGGDPSRAQELCFYMLPSCPAQISCVSIHPLTPLSLSRENRSVKKAAMLSKFRIGHTFSSLSPSSTSGERERERDSSGRVSYFICNYLRMRSCFLNCSLKGTEPQDPASFKSAVIPISNPLFQEYASYMCDPRPPIGLYVTTNMSSFLSTPPSLPDWTNISPP